jgi:hypothetical protein
MTATVSVADEGPMERLEALGSSLRSAPAWHATYDQVYIAAGMTMGDEESGEVWVAWPDRALFRSGTPLVREFGLENRRVRLLDLEVPSCDEHVIDDDEWARIPLAAVLDPRAAIDRFTVMRVGDGIVLVPRSPGGVARVEVRLDPDRLPTTVVVIDPQGNTNTLHFSEWRAVVEPPSGHWLPTPPPGVECAVD